MHIAAFRRRPRDMWISYQQGLTKSPAWCCCTDYAGGKASVAIGQCDRECLCFLISYQTAPNTHTHAHAHFPAHENRQLYKMYDKNPHRKEAKLFKIKGLSQCRRESIWKVVELIHEWMLELIICVLFMPLIVISSKCLAASTHALNTVK